MKDNLSGKLINEEIIMEKFWMTVKSEIHQLPDGKQVDFNVIEAPNWVSIVPITDNNEFLMVRQYRPAWRKVSLEFPAGQCNNKEPYLDAAKRELQEETGYLAAEINELGGANPVSWTTQHAKFFSASNLTFKGQNLDDEEFIEVEFIPISEFWSFVERGEIIKLTTIFAYFLWNEQG